LVQEIVEASLENNLDVIIVAEAEHLSKKQYYLKKLA